jgi:hypothetical protein
VGAGLFCENARALLKAIMESMVETIVKYLVIKAKLSILSVSLKNLSIWGEDSRDAMADPTDASP